ncbi:Differentially expressed in FDCP 8 like [Actinidia chinensis var. chinensis]|uniref:Differentially expressed in FDCP 8 like n=1 Tax=Actinidia chinensis var. chinensis TaxID=1590841 RepID=A0A2R6QGM0_ACTCC|nr:Differentially expressed in FDCP 8 like [Actinidia chinensis var. chinensis]
MNGEGTGEAPFKFSSPDPIDELVLPWETQKSNGGDESPVGSQYSSCGESEFERYCSANSVMGTPSMCSSIGTFQECDDSEFGSVRSFGIGDVGSLENISLGGGFARKFGERKLSSSGGSGCLSDHRIDSCEGKNISEVTNDVEGQVLVGINDDIECSLQHDSDHAYTGDACESELPAVVGLNTILGEELFFEDDGGSVVRWRDRNEYAVLQSSAGTLSAQQIPSLVRVEVETHSQINIEPVNNCLEGVCSHSVVEYNERDGGRCFDEDNASSRFEHSEGEDSMFGYDIEDEQKIDLLHQRNMQYHQNSQVEKENSLFMSSSVAFGSDDWDDFEQETRESDKPSVMLGERQPNVETERILPSNFSQTETQPPAISPDQDVMTDVSVPTDELEDVTKDSSLNPYDFQDFCETGQGKDAEDIRIANNQAGDLNESVDYLKNFSGSDIFQREKDILPQKAPSKKCLNFMGGDLRNGSPLLSTWEFDYVNGSRVSECQESEKSTLLLDPLPDVAASQLCSASTKTPEDQRVGFLREPLSSLPMDENNINRPLKESPSLGNLFEDYPKSVKTQNLELNELYNDVVHEMEEILLDSTESPGARFTHGDTAHQSYLSLPSRDGGSTASTSGNDDTCLLIQRPLTIDGVEVVGAKQKKGDVSFSERLVGVKEYTVYIIRVWSGKDHWEVERRYRDFCTLYRRLKTFFDGQGWILPAPWSSVERESRKIFGNVSPDVIAERSVLIQDCLQSIIHSRFPSSFPSALIWFFSPPKVVPSSPASNTFNPQSPFSARGTNTDNVLTLGKTISLVVEIRPYKSIKQILEAQHNTCAACHKHFDDGKTRMLEFVQTLGWGKPRLCEYTGQLFCSSCHTNEIAVLPARVLHHWDFTPHPVSQLAKSYLDSIHDKPMLCVSAVNPILFSKVPALVQVTGVRKRIGAMLPYVRCPFRMSIYRGLASRRYLLESNDFFALRDLIDLSKGPFAVLPVMVETVSRTILEHITEQCLVCCDVGVPCNARQACDDPSSLIFPFQEGEIERCSSCKSGFHKPCFRKITSCPCGQPLKQDGQKGVSTSVSLKIDDEMSSTVDLLGRKSDSNSTMRFLSGLFTKARQEKLSEPKDGNTTILMGSLPCTSL